MQDTNCPLCYTELVTKDVTPCMDCGWDENELDHYKTHRYVEYELYFKERLTLCNFCDVDFGSYDPTYFGFKKGQRIGFEDFYFAKEIKDVSIRKDKFCPSCVSRLPFLKFVQKCREENKAQD